MKISEMKELLTEIESKYGDIEIELRDRDGDNETWPAVDVKFVQDGFNRHVEVE